MGSWVANELRYVSLGDKRRGARLVRLVEALSEKPTATVPEACGSWTATKGAYRFWDSEEVMTEAIWEGVQCAIRARLVKEGVVLAIQDTTSLDFTHHPATKGLGYLDHEQDQGLKVHSVLAVSLAGVPLGVVEQEVWTRDAAALGKRHTRHERVTAEKESQRWLTGAATAEEVIPAEVGVIHVADREADLYDFLVQERRAGADLLVRARHNRVIDDEARYMEDAVRRRPPCGETTVTVTVGGGRETREARVVVRHGTWQLAAPVHRKGRRHLPLVSMQVVLLEEETPPAAVKPVHWLLLTTLPVENFSQATAVARLYSYRWLIEHYHYTLKSGCHLEELQLKTAARLQRALVTYSLVAWRLLWLTYEARVHPDQPCDTALDLDEWQSLYCMIHHTPVPATSPPTLHQAVRWIAQLGGFLARTGDGEPGVKVIWRGLCRLDDIAATWRLLHSPPPLDT